MVLRTPLPTVCGIRAGLLAPLLARTLKESRLARLQSMAASSPNQLRSISCNRCQTPACCQSRSRRQQVVPLPHPSAWGTSRQGHPVLNTKMIPSRAARSGTRGRPPFGLGGSLGNSGSMVSQRSETSDEAFMAGYDASTPQICNMVKYYNGTCLGTASLGRFLDLESCPILCRIRLGLTRRVACMIRRITVSASSRLLQCRP